MREISIKEVDWLGVIPIEDRLEEMKFFYEDLIDRSNITNDISKEELLPYLKLQILNCICDVVMMTKQPKSVKLRMMNDAVRLSGIHTGVTPEQYVREMGDTIKPRLEEAGANLSKVKVIDDSEEALTLSDDRIEKAVRQKHVRLVIIDPVQAFIGADVDMNRANEVRPVFRKLEMIAEKTGCAIVLIGHLNKSSGTQSTYRGLGSIDIMAAVRSLIFIGKVRKDPITRVLIHEKSSLAPPGETMAFKLGDEEGFRWVGAYEISADELLDGKEGKATETKLEKGRKLIRELLADKKEIFIRELDEKAKEQGISGRTMRDVRSRMKNELEYRVNEKQENSIRLKE